MKTKQATAVGLIGVPIDYSAFGHASGCSQGPRALREGGLLQGLRRFSIPYVDYGDVVVPIAGEIKNRCLKYLPEITKATKAVYQQTAKCLQEGRMPIVIGGDHSGSIGSIKAVRDYYRGKIGVLYMDSHPDCNTETTTTSGNIHGMVIPQFTKGGVKELMGVGGNLSFKQLAYLGIKNADLAELEFIKKNRITAADIWEVQEQGIARALARVLKALLSNQQKIYVSLDLDVVDIQYAPGVGTPTHGGMAYREMLFVFRALRKLWADGRIVGFDVMELNPALDQEGKTVSLGAELILSLLGYEYGPYTIFKDKRGPI